jgi:serine/threonine protein phosphatase PrpC
MFDDRGVWVVADGMGGHAGGDIASRLAIAAIGSYSEPLRTDISAHRPQQDDATLLRQAIEQANHIIRQEALDRPDLTGMGTTLVLLRITVNPAPCAIVAHVGDSRAYLIRNGQLAQLTQDHSWVEEQIRHGRLGYQEARSHPMRHVLTRALGTEPTVIPDISSHPLDPEDAILLCTDGLTKMLDDEEIVRTFLRAGTSREHVCQALIQEANRRGGQDNTTVVIVRPGD